MQKNIGRLSFCCCVYVRERETHNKYFMIPSASLSALQSNEGHAGWTRWRPSKGRVPHDALPAGALFPGTTLRECPLRDSFWKHVCPFPCAPQNGAPKVPPPHSWEPGPKAAVWAPLSISRGRTEFPGPGLPARGLQPAPGELRALPPHLPGSHAVGASLAACGQEEVPPGLGGSKGHVHYHRKCMGGGLGPGPGPRRGSLKAGGPRGVLGRASAGALWETDTPLGRPRGPQPGPRRPRCEPFPFPAPAGSHSLPMAVVGSSRREITPGRIWGPGLNLDSST